MKLNITNDKSVYNQTTRPFKFRTKTWVEINDQSDETYGTNSKIKFKTTMLKSSSCNYSDAYILAYRLRLHIAMDILNKI